MKTLLAAYYLFLFYCYHFEAVASIKCELTECFPRIPRNINLTMMFSMFEKEIDVTCNQFKVMDNCVKNFSRNCAQVASKPQESKIIQTWTNAQPSFNYLCVTEKAVFNKNRECLSTSAYKASLAKCQKFFDKKDSRVKRHSCEDHEEAINCVGKTTKQLCPRDDLPTKVTKMIDNFVGEIFLDHKDHCSHRHDAVAADAKGGAANVLVAKSILWLLLLFLRFNL